MKKSFKKYLKHDIIPRLCNIIENEKLHLVYLKTNKARKNLIEKSERLIKNYEEKYNNYLKLELD